MHCWTRRRATILQMPELSEPAHYIVFHPENQRRAVSVRASAIIRGRFVKSWAGKVWVDSLGGNEDPFVFGTSWAYSYCHATQLRREPQRHGGYVRKGSCILFCSGDHGDDGVLAVDTVFWVSEVHPWMSPSRPHSRYSRDVEDKTDLWNFHLRFGGRRGHHQGKYTYEAALYPQPDFQYSRLPLNDKGHRVQVSLRDLPSNLQARVTNSLHGKRPVLLSGPELRSVLQSVKAQTAVAVVGEIAPDDDTFTQNRITQETGRPPCRPKASKICC